MNPIQMRCSFQIENSIRYLLSGLATCVRSASPPRPPPDVALLAIGNVNCGTSTMRQWHPWWRSSKRSPTPARRSPCRHLSPRSGAWWICDRQGCCASSGLQLAYLSSALTASPAVWEASVHSAAVVRDESGYQTWRDRPSCPAGRSGHRRWANRACRTARATRRPTGISTDAPRIRDRHARSRVPQGW